MVMVERYSQNGIKKLMMENKYDEIYKKRKLKARQYYKTLKDTTNLERYELVRFILTHPNDENNYQIKRLVRDKYIL